MSSKLALVTGAGGAIGGATARRLQADGWDVVGLDLRFSDGAVGEQITCDLADEDAVVAVADSLADRGVACLANVAGVTPVARFLEHDRADWSNALAVNTLAPMLLCQRLVPGMAERGWGRVVNVASEAARTGASGLAVYSASKGALISFTKSLAQEVGRSGVTVNCVAPGTIDTPMSAPNPEMKVKLERKTPLGRLGRADDVAAAVVFLASDEASYITGEVISVSGGLTMAS